MQVRASQIEVETNNILVYLDCSFSRFGGTQLYPYGPPAEQYGATFGRLGAMPVIPPYVAGALTRTEEPELEVIKHFRDLYSRGLILMTTSGLEMRAQYKGPHVRSFHNALLKRALLASGVPTVLVLEETKLRKRFDPTESYQICSSEKAWRETCASIPLAIATAYEDAAFANETSAWFRECGLTFEERPPSTDGYSCVILSNQSFQSALSLST